MRMTINIILGTILSIAVVLVPYNSFSQMKASNDKESISCCKSMDNQMADNGCDAPADEEKGCDGGCSTNCCCLKLVLKNESLNPMKIPATQINKEVADSYQIGYKYSFHNKIDRPPIQFIS